MGTDTGTTPSVRIAVGQYMQALLRVMLPGGARSAEA
jgi:hypothetical protein